MARFSSRALGLASSAFVLVAGSSFANAATYTLDIIDYIDAGSGGSGVGSSYGGVLEQAVTSALNFSNDGIMVTAYGGVGSPGTGYPTLGSSGGSTSSATFAYLDGGNAGMGVCSSGVTVNSGGRGQCNIASDDNVTGNGTDAGDEVLSIAFNGTFNIDDLLFRFEGHTPEFYGDGAGTDTTTNPLYIDVAVGAGSYTSYLIENVSSTAVLGAKLAGTWAGINGLVAGTLIHMRFNNEQFYLSGIVLNNDPLQEVPTGSASCWLRPAFERAPRHGVLWSGQVKTVELNNIALGNIYFMLTNWIPKSVSA